MRNDEETLLALLERGDALAVDGTPLVPAWRRVRAHLQLAVLLTGRDDVSLGAFETRFPKRFHALPDEVRKRCPSRHAYRAMRRAVPRLLAIVGVYGDDKWNALRLLVRVCGDERAFNALGPLAKAARADGRAPTDIDHDWAIARDRLLGQVERAKLRRGVAALGRVRHLDIVAASGLLPALPVGKFPVHVRGGRVFEPLPPRLAALCASLRDENEKASISILSRILRLQDGLGLSADPAVDDILGIWDRIARYEGAEPLGMSRRSYFNRRASARRVLLRHAGCSAPNHTYDRKGRPVSPLPPRLAAIAETASSIAGTGLRAMWRMVCAGGGLDLPGDPSADDLMAIWDKIEALFAKETYAREHTRTTYLSAVRIVLSQHAACRPAPRVYHDRQGRAIAPLPPRLAAICAARAPGSADRKALRLVWRLALCIDDLDLPQDPCADDLLTVWPRIATMEAVALGVTETTASLARSRAWKILAAAATFRDIEITEAIMEEAPPEGTPPVTEPVRWSEEFNDLAMLMGYAPSTCRAFRAALARGFRRAEELGGVSHETGLVELIARLAPETGRPSLASPDLARLSAALRMAECPPWRVLQDAVRRAGVPLARNPSLALFESVDGSLEPNELTREWAWRHERILRPDLRLTFAANIERVDALHGLPVLAESGLLPSERLGPLPPRGGRCAHAVYPLPRPVEIAVAALPCEARQTVEGSAHFFWRHARDAGLYGPTDAPEPYALFAEANLVRILAAIPHKAQPCTATTRAHVRAVAALAPARADTPKAAWARLFVVARAEGLSASALVPLYVLKAAALLDGLLPTELTRSWALAIRGKLPRGKANTFDRGLRIFDALATMPDGAVLTAPIGDGRPAKL